MSGNTPVSAEYPLTLQAIDFFRELKNELLTGTHDQYLRGDNVCIGCFRQHVIRANQNMTMPLPPIVLRQAMIPITAFVHAIITNPVMHRSVCIELGTVLEQVLLRRIISTDHLFEE